MVQLLTAPKYLFRRTDAELLQQKLRVAEKISAEAGRPTAALAVEPRRLTTAAIIAQLQPSAALMDAVADDVTLTTEDVSHSLDRIEYDLASIRDEIAAFMPAESGQHKRPCERNPV